MNFRQFAFNNVKRNLRAYSAYFLSSAFAVMIFFTYALFIYHPELAKSGLGEAAKMGMKGASYVTFVFSFLFVLYSISAFLKIRNKEFGVLTILGAQRNQINKLVFLENILIGFGAIVAGILGGLLFSKIFLVYGSSVVETKLPFYFPLKAMGLTAASFAALYLVISFATLFFIRQKRALELLMGTSKPKTEPKAHILLVLFSLVSIGTAYYLLYDDFNNFYWALGLGIIGNYFFFTQLSVYLMRLLKKSRSFFWKGTRMLWVSEMAYKIKDNARMFFMVTIVIAMASAGAGLVYSFDQDAKARFKETPFALEFNLFKEYKNWEGEVKKIDQELQGAGLKFDKVTGKTVNLKLGSKKYVNVMKESEYAQMAKVLERKAPQKLKPNEAIFLVSTLEKEPEKVQAGQKVSKYNLQVVGNIEKSIDYSSRLVVSDETYKQILADEIKKVDEAKEDIRAQERTSVYYHVPAWSNTDYPRSDSVQAKLSTKLQNMGQEQEDSYIDTRAGSYIGFQQARSIFTFIALFMAAVFSVASASFLYFKLYTDLNQDQRMYHMLSKVGLSTRDMKRTSTIQIAMLFFIPLVVAGLESGIGLQIINKHMGGFSVLDMITPTLVGISGFFVVQIIYFFIIRAIYLKQLSKVMISSGK
ncbi:putative ABC transport system permease protein [Thermoactinomyces sp. DSM 45891]|uniref:ABC transporter permease n=1 Tax=Thermoactinomyces sp. DSM 45891 TaxID=1761907 RepID=UPI00091A2072|nr:ABC transporter permease [Thermoactinomyces sp. DSM 45891]SFX04124.1 putative ABC transport system permease protein [Thermoactinomyces sp. DSM 45891]